MRLVKRMAVSGEDCLALEHGLSLSKETVELAAELPCGAGRDILHIRSVCELVSFTYEAYVN